MATESMAPDQVRAALQQLTTAWERPEFRDRIEAALAGNKRAAKTWLQQHEQVDTLQLTVQPGGQLTGGWHAGMRFVSVRSNHARLGSSRRDFAGLTGVAASADTWIGHDGRTLIIYSSQPLL